MLLERLCAPQLIADGRHPQAEHLKVINDDEEGAHVHRSRNVNQPQIGFDAQVHHPGRCQAVVVVQEEQRGHYLKVGGLDDERPGQPIAELLRLSTPAQVEFLHVMDDLEEAADDAIDASVVDEMVHDNGGGHDEHTDVGHGHGEHAEVPETDVIPTVQGHGVVQLELGEYEADGVYGRVDAPWPAGVVREGFEIDAKGQESGDVHVEQVQREEYAE